MIPKLFFKKKLSPSAGVSIVSLLLVFGMGAAASAQTERGFTGEIGGGYTPLVGSLSNRLDNGWNMRVGVGYNFQQPLLGNSSVQLQRPGSRQQRATGCESSPVATPMSGHSD